MCFGFNLILMSFRYSGAKIKQHVLNLTIITNIAVALTGIGAIFMAPMLIYSKMTKGRALLFFQKPKTISDNDSHCFVTGSIIKCFNNNG